jgi:REP element-mobilizing transposase RayT
MFTDPLNNEIHIRQGAYLPHWTKKEGTYFVTFRLAGSLPALLQKEIEYLRTDIYGTAKQMKRSFTDSENSALEELHFRTLDILERDQKNRFLERDNIAQIVANALTCFDGSRYELYSWVIMPNHVHVVFKTIGEWSLEKILHSWKSFTANAANKILDRTGTFWQQESYDHLIRNERDFMRCIDYTWLNSEKAGFMNWKWRWKSAKEFCFE